MQPLSAWCAVISRRPSTLSAHATPTESQCPRFLLLAFGSIFFVIQGFMLGNWPLIITNTITTVSSAIVFIIKVHNDRKKKR